MPDEQNTAADCLSYADTSTQYQLLPNDMSKFDCFYKRVIVCVLHHTNVCLNNIDHLILQMQNTKTISQKIYSINIQNQYSIVD